MTHFKIQLKIRLTNIYILLFAKIKINFIFIQTQETYEISNKEENLLQL